MLIFRLFSFNYALYFSVRAGRKPSSVIHGHSSKAWCYHQALAVITHPAIPIRQRRSGIRRGPSQSGTYSTLLKTGFSKLGMLPSHLVSSYLTFSPLPCGTEHLSTTRRFPFLWHSPWGHPHSVLRSALP